MIRIGFDAEDSVYLTVDITWDGRQTPSDADLISLAGVILASDAVQNAVGWVNPPSLTSIYVDSQRTVYPSE